MSGHTVPRALSPSVSDSSEDYTNSLFDFVDVDDAFHTTHTDQDLNSNEHARQRRELLDLINRLQAIGLGAELELPQIACVGSQSVGKSSLIESISGIALPRASGTCTRCPIECRLKRSEQEWTATVYLRFESGKSGYEGKTSEVQFGSQMTDRKEVQERIRRAQLAILNPTMEPATFLTADENMKYPSSRSFSQNCVIVVLEGRELSDLNFVDLPGLIANVTDDKNVGDIELVEKLVTSYISRPSCLILLTISCESDYENQGAGRLARKHDPQGQRTIGVLTKPDRIERGSELPWISMIKNKSNALRHGWFSVKQPSARELDSGMSWSDGRKHDRKFFEDTAPWSTIGDEWRKRLGCSNLISHLGETLGKVILTRLPHICDEVDRLVTLNASQLASLPHPPSLDPLAEVLQLISAFTREVTHHVKGDPQSGRAGLVQSLVMSAKTFQEKLRENIPVFRPTMRGDGVDALGAPEFLPPGEIWPSTPEQGQTYWLEDVMELAEGARTRELPGEIPFAVTEELITRTLKLWRDPVQDVFARAERIFVQRLTNLVETHFGKHSYGGLRAAVLKIVLEKLEELKMATLQELEFLVDMESLPFTLNSHYYLDYKEKFLKYYAACRNNKSKQARSLKKSSSVSDHIEEALACLSLAGFEGLKREDLLKLLPSDFSQQAALEIMASARAYYQVAYKRFADTVPLAIDQRYIRAFERSIQTALVSGLKISSPDAHERCTKWMAESHSIVRRRAELSDRKERLEAARMELMEVPGVVAMRGRMSKSDSKPFARPQPPPPVASEVRAVMGSGESVVKKPTTKRKPDATKASTTIATPPTLNSTAFMDAIASLNVPEPPKPKVSIPPPALPSGVSNHVFSFPGSGGNASAWGAPGTSTNVNVFGTGR